LLLYNLGAGFFAVLRKTDSKTDRLI